MNLDHETDAVAGSNPLRFPDGDGDETPKILIPVVVGTRPEAIKLVPVIVALRDSEMFQPVVVSTGQHHHMVEEIFEQAGVGTHVHLWAGAERASLTERVTTTMRRFNDFCLEWFGPRPSDEEIGEAIVAGNYPAAVIVHGDTSSAMSAALASFHLQIPVLHVEAGLRTGGSIMSPFPEELNRQVITCLAAMNFAPTYENLENLVRENVEVGQIFVTGNTGIDALRWASTLDTPYVDPAIAALHESNDRVVLVTAHRRENWGSGLGQIAEGIRKLAHRFPDVTFVVPLHPNPRVRQELGEPLVMFDNVLLTEPLEYTSFARLIGRCSIVITDSGGIQEEAPSLNKPVLVARESTERGEGVHAGTLILVGTDPELIESEAAKLLEDDAAYSAVADAPNPYGDGYAADRIVQALEYLLTGESPPIPFGHGFSRSEIADATGIRVPKAQAAKHRTPVVEDILHDAHEPTELESWPL
ncbi:MAG: non-hydrolyzing UDP-N-acetylglucosamine 2-epimerase [Solirubrobacterales bacterium]